MVHRRNRRDPHELGDDRGKVALPFEHLLDMARALQVAAAALVTGPDGAGGADRSILSPLGQIVSKHIFIGWNIRLVGCGQPRVIHEVLPVNVLAGCVDSVSTRP